MMNRRSFLGSMAALVPATGLLKILEPEQRSRVLSIDETTDFTGEFHTVIYRQTVLFVANNDKSRFLACEAFRAHSRIPGFWRRTSWWSTAPEWH